MAETVPAAGAPKASRLDRRKARTRQALIDAAARLIAEGRGDQASIQEMVCSPGRSSRTSPGIATLTGRLAPSGWTARVRRSPVSVIWILGSRLRAREPGLYRFKTRRTVSNLRIHEISYAAR